MKNNKMNESRFDEISIKNDFNGFGDDSYDDTFDDEFESPIEDVEYATFDTAKIDELVIDENYMGFRDYLKQLSDNDRHDALEYVKNNHLEFLTDEEGNLFEPMKGGSTNKELADDLKNKPTFDRSNIKDELSQNLFDSYKNAA